MKPNRGETRIKDSLDRSVARIGYRVRVTVIGLVSLFGMLMAPSTTVFGQTTMADYTSYPLFLNQTVRANLLMVIDFSEGMLQAAYGEYPKSSSGLISSNVNGTGLCNTNTNTATDSQPVGCPAADAPADTFDPTSEYFGMFSPLRCYSAGANIFLKARVKASVTSSCLSTEWDGNFLNWLTMRKLDVAKKVLIGGKSLAASNSDGSANSLLAENKTGEHGSAWTCNTAAQPCFRFVKQASGSGTYYPANMEKDEGNVTYFGVGEGNLYVEDDPEAAEIFGDGTTFKLKVDLTQETDEFVFSESTGLIQRLNDDNTRLALMFINSDPKNAATVFQEFDGNFTSSDITNIRNQTASGLAALGESTYEALCYYRNSQGPCYASTPADFAASVGAAGDPFFFADTNQMVPCCKSFVLMVSGGQPSGDGAAPDLTSPFGNLFLSDTIGLSTTPLDDVAFYGQTHDIRDQASGSPGYLAGSQNVTFYAVSAMGDAAGAALLASAAKYGGFQDRNNNGVTDLTGQTCTYPAGSRLGSGASVSNAEWDEDRDCIPDTFYDASDGPALEAKINEAVVSILKRSAAGSSASVLASSSTGEGVIYQAYFFSSQLEGFNEITWTGYTQSLFLDTFGNLREDSDQDAKLVYEKDLIVRTRLDSTSNEVKVDRFKDANGDGQADSSTPFETVGLKDINGIWEAGRRLALTDPGSRTIKTWVDKDDDGYVDSGEVIDFTTTNATTLAPYLRAGATPYTADNIINFIRGSQVTGLRDRQLTVKNDSGASVLKVWKYGDPVSSAPTVVAAPSERFDVIYGDASYTDFRTKYKNRRQVVYVGANDGMLHAFNVGFHHPGDDANTTDIEHGYITRTPTGNSSGKLLGEELWGFIPQELLPHLQWLADPNYTHVYYVDLKPKVTDVRIFADDTDHPNGWGTIVIGGMRFGGSCGSCTSSNGAPPMTVTGDFDNNAATGDTTRTFYSAYFVLDITNPEASNYPKLLWSFSAADLGLSTSFPAVVRVNPSTSTETDNTNAKWYVLVGSGPTGYDGSSAQTGKIFAIDIKTGPKNASGTNLVTTFATSDTAFMGDMISLDSDLDYRADTAYLGDVISNGTTPDWIGKMYRLTTDDGSPTLGNWGIASGSDRQPTVLLETFPANNTTKVGPILAAPTVTIDDSRKIWVFFGTGRFLSVADKTNTDTQHFFGVKDPVVTGGCTESTVTNCAQNDLVNVSGATICLVCDTGVDQVTGVSGVTTFDGTGTTSLIGLVQSKDGWYTTLPAVRERNLSAPTLLGGTVFFTTFVPDADLCSVSGQGYLYALFYLTGSGYTESVIGTEEVGGNTNVLRSVSLGTGLPSQMAVQIGSQGTGASGATSGSGCVGGVTGFTQTSSGAMSQMCAKTALSSWSRYITLLVQRG